MRLCRYVDGDYDDAGWEPVKMPWEYITDLYGELKTKLYARLDKDTKHARICKIIGRHKSPHADKDPSTPFGLEHLSWDCVRCGQHCEVNLTIPDVEDTAMWSDWREYARLIDLPKIEFNVPNEPWKPDP